MFLLLNIDESLELLRCVTETRDLLDGYQQSEPLRRGEGLETEIVLASQLNVILLELR